MWCPPELDPSGGVGSGDPCDEALLCRSSQQLLLDELFILAAAVAGATAAVVLMLDGSWLPAVDAPTMPAPAAEGVEPLTSNTSESESSHTTLVSMACSKDKRFWSFKVI